MGWTSSSRVMRRSLWFAVALSDWWYRRELDARARWPQREISRDPGRDHHYARVAQGRHA